MPAIITKRGKRRVLASVQVNKERRQKLFPDASKDSQRSAAQWEKDTKKELQESFEKNTASVSIENWMLEYLEKVKKTIALVTFKEKQDAFKRLASFEPIKADMPVDIISERMAEMFLEEQAVKRSGNAANKNRKNLATAWDWGKRRYDMWPKSSNPFRSLKKFPENRCPRYVPPEADFWKIYEAAEDRQDKTMLLAFIMTAARRSEIFRLKRIDVDFENARIRLWTRKREGGAWEYDWLPMTSELKSALLEWLEIRLSHDTLDKDHVFVCLRPGFCERDYYGQPFKYRIKFMKDLCETAGVKHFGFHAIRHLTASILYRKGYSLGYIQEVLRHKNPNTTARYLKTLGLERVRKALEDGIRVPGKLVGLFDRQRAFTERRLSD